MEEIRFYAARDEFGCFSNFAPYPIKLSGKRWPTSEHFYQAQKFIDVKDRELVRKAKTPGKAASLGRDRRRKLRRDWESVKVGIMRQAVRAKFTQHDDIRKILLSTGDARIVEHTERDAFWGDGGDGRGRNMLGRILMEVRREFKESVA